jgi:hypothetical protein
MPGNLDYDMVGSYGDFAAGQVIQSQWGDDVNINLDDKVSKTSNSLGTTGNISFSTTNDEITRASGSWITDNVVVGTIVGIKGSVSNDGYYTVTSIQSATVIRVAENLTTESAVAATVTLFQPLASGLDVNGARINNYAYRAYSGVETFNIMTRDTTEGVYPDFYIITATYNWESAIGGDDHLNYAELTGTNAEIALARPMGIPPEVDRFKIWLQAGNSGLDYTIRFSVFTSNSMARAVDYTVGAYDSDDIVFEDVTPAYSQWKATKDFTIDTHTTTTPAATYPSTHGFSIKMITTSGALRFMSCGVYYWKN